MEIYPISLQIVFFFRNFDLKKTLDAVQKMADDKNIIERDIIPQINNIVPLPDSPIINWNEDERSKQILFQIRNNRADFILNLSDSEKNAENEFKKAFGKIIDIYNFISNFCTSINRIGIVSTSVVKLAQNEIVGLDSLFKNNNELNNINLNASYKIEVLEKIQAYDNISVFDNFNFNKLSDELKNFKLIYIRRDINSGIVNPSINEEYLDNFKKKVLELTKNEEMLKLINGIIKNV